MDSLVWESDRSTYSYRGKGVDVVILYLHQRFQLLYAAVKIGSERVLAQRPDDAYAKFILHPLQRAAGEHHVHMGRSFYGWLYELWRDVPEDEQEEAMCF